VRFLILYALLVALVSSGCGHGPAITLCQIDGNDTRRAMDCSNNSSRTAESADRDICLSRNDAEIFFNGCRERRSVTVDFCMVNGLDAILDCASIKGGIEREYRLSWVQAAGFICSDPMSFRRYFEWCMR
jgi:hypothetical protein